ncbi:MAG: helix-turn-helix domain-containing protein [Actinophytocola sp.]|nr:helix-turn-helix domain-containing protein [Actinophytocola sp.]
MARTLAVLAAFREERRDLGIADLAARLSLSASTVHRIVRALTAEGYLAQNEETERYYLGRSVVLLGQAANRRLGLHLAQTVLDSLGEETGESVNLGVREQNEMVVVMRVESPHPLRFSQGPGSRLPVYASAMGKVTLARSPSIDDEVAGLPTPLTPLTANTITSPEKLRRELMRINGRGYSTDYEEAIMGVRCLAAPVMSPHGAVLAAIGIQAPAVRMPRARLHKLAPLALAAAEEVAQMVPDAHHL